MLNTVVVDAQQEEQHALKSSVLDQAQHPLNAFELQQLLLRGVWDRHRVKGGRRELPQLLEEEEEV